MHTTEQIDQLPADLSWSVPSNNPISISKVGNEVLFKFEWFGSMFIDPDIGLLFSVCDKTRKADKFTCSDPEKMTFSSYQVSLSYKRFPKLAIDVVIIALDIDGEPIISTGVHHFHCMLCKKYIIFYGLVSQLNICFQIMK